MPCMRVINLRPRAGVGNVVGHAGQETFVGSLGCRCCLSWCMSTLLVSYRGFGGGQGICSMALSWCMSETLQCFIPLTATVR